MADGLFNMSTDLLNIINRNGSLFQEELITNQKKINLIIKSSSFLVIGGAGSIGREVVKILFSRNAKKLHVVDISENNLAELVRDLRSQYGYLTREFKTLALDISSNEYDAFINSDGKYDYVMNLSALKHVRSEKDPYTLMRLVRVNIFNTIKTIELSLKSNVKKYFCVSTDKASNPVNLMGASKLIMEMFLQRYVNKINISSARFANVAFSDGSLLDSFQNRFNKSQPMVSPRDIERYFITPEESGILCLMSCLFGNSNEIFFPKIKGDFRLIKISTIAQNFIKSKNFEPVICNSEEEARDKIDTYIQNNKWPLYLSDSDTTGEKPYEEFYTSEEMIENNRYHNIGVISSFKDVDEQLLKNFESNFQELIESNNWTKLQIVEEFKKILPGLDYFDMGKYLDEKM